MVRTGFLLLSKLSCLKKKITAVLPTTPPLEPKQFRTTGGSTACEIQIDII